MFEGRGWLITRRRRGDVFHIDGRPFTISGFNSRELSFRFGGREYIKEYDVNRKRPFSLVALPEVEFGVNRIEGPNIHLAIKAHKHIKIEFPKR